MCQLVGGRLEGKEDSVLKIPPQTMERYSMRDLSLPTGRASDRARRLPCQQQWGDPSDRESVLAFGKYLKGKKERERLMRESEGN